MHTSEANQHKFAKLSVADGLILIFLISRKFSLVGNSEDTSFELVVIY